MALRRTSPITNHSPQLGQARLAGQCPESSAGVSAADFLALNVAVGGLDKRGVLVCTTGTSVLLLMQYISLLT